MREKRGELFIEKNDFRQEFEESVFGKSGKVCSRWRLIEWVSGTVSYAMPVTRGLSEFLFKWHTARDRPVWVFWVFTLYLILVSKCEACHLRTKTIPDNLRPLVKRKVARTALKISHDHVLNVGFHVVEYSIQL